MTSSTLGPATERLIAYANASGGWGYHAGKSSRIEPTTWALLALAPAGWRDLETHRRFLLGTQRASGLFVEAPALPPNLAFNALAAIMMLSHREAFGDAAIRRVVEAIAGSAGARADQSPHFRQDNSLRGWPWIDGTFSWVEPTAWGLLALKIARRMGLAPEGVEDRTGEAERFLADRACQGGGWNYGNANAFGKDLYPYVSTTAPALLALQDRRDLQAVSAGITFLESHWPNQASAIGLGLTSICLRQLGRPAGTVLERLADSITEQPAVASIHSIAVASYAALPSDHARAFTI